MSAEGLQSALIALVRFPDNNRGKQARDFVKQFDLTDGEEWQVLSLASSYYVAKFGREQRTKRFDICIKGFLPITVKVVGAKIMAWDIFGRKFEPLYPKLGVAEITKTFGHFFLQHGHAIRDEFKLPPYIVDLARYEFAVYLVKGKSLESEWHVPQNSLLLKTSVLSIIELEYDILDFVEKAKGLTDDDLRSLTARASANIVLIAKVPKPKSQNDARLVYQFQIDNDVRCFLEGELREPVPEARKLPTCFSELVTLGICRPLPE